MGNKGRGEKTKMNKGRREGQGERANNNKEFSYVFVWCLFRSLIGPKSGQNPKKKKHPNLQPHFSSHNTLPEKKKEEKRKEKKKEEKRKEKKKGFVMAGKPKINRTSKPVVPQGGLFVVVLWLLFVALFLVVIL